MCLIYTFKYNKHIINIYNENIEDVKNIKITELENQDTGDYTYLSYEVSYEYKKDNKFIKMANYIIFNQIDKDGRLLLNKVNVLTNKSSIFELYSNINQKG